MMRYCGLLFFFMASLLGTQPAVAQRQPAPVRNDSAGMPVLTIEISLVKSRIRSVDELKLLITIGNYKPGIQQFLFDRPVRPGFSPWGTSCFITNAKGQSVLKSNKLMGPASKVYTWDMVQPYRYRLRQREWIMKQIPVKELVAFDEKICRNGRLPNGTYSLRLELYNNVSNTVTFTVRN